LVFYKVYEKYQDFSLYRYLCINFYKRSLPEDITSSAEVSFLINHIGAGFAVCSLGLSLLIPKNPTTGVELRSQEY
jgi:hypothetical protein|tara:strand:- start:4723 stop:4950 length:228 start_codon:yes stop_codon:yes gene_type:complete